LSVSFPYIVLPTNPTQPSDAEGGGAEGLRGLAMALSLRDAVIVLINEANLSESPEEKLAQAQEILLKRERALLGEFLEHMLDFQVRRTPPSAACGGAFPPCACLRPRRRAVWPTGLGERCCGGLSVRGG
jgi:hypothetical protein